jgi:hypothetical protein
MCDTNVVTQMARNNPFAGVSFGTMLAKAIEGSATISTQPPSSGGTQVSLRFNEDRLALLDTLSARTGWNRNQIVSALVDSGLFSVFEQLRNATVEDVMTAFVNARMARFLKGRLYNSDRDIVMFTAQVGAEQVGCAISREALEDHFGGDKGQLLQAFDRNRPAVEGVAERLIREGRLEADGSVLIRTADC